MLEECGPGEVRGTLVCLYGQGWEGHGEREKERVVENHAKAKASIQLEVGVQLLHWASLKGKPRGKETDWPLLSCPTLSYKHACAQTQAHKHIQTA